jgi:hypothetical protein
LIDVFPGGLLPTKRPERGKSWSSNNIVIGLNDFFSRTMNKEINFKHSSSSNVTESTGSILFETNQRRLSI